MHKSKNRYFYHISVSPGDAPGAITLSVMWMEREFDAYKLSRCMCPFNYKRFWDRARYLWKNRHFFIPSCIRRFRSRRNIGTPFGTKKLEWCRYPMVKKFRRYVYSFCHDPRTWRTDGRTDTASQQRPRLCICIARWKVKWITHCLQRIKERQHECQCTNA